MNFDVAKHKGELLFLPLGGSGEIGMNLNLYHYQGKWLIIDLGIGFVTDYCPGTEVMVPNIEFIEKHRENIVGLVLTHAHEDHLGAVPYLWNDLQCPIYTTKFTSAVLKAKFSESGVGKSAKIHELELNSRFSVGPFDLELRGMTHSIPEMHAVMIRTDKGNILHTGDWKIDNNPMIGESIDEKALKKLGKEGILAMVGDSTNIFHEGHSGSEGELSESLEKIIKSISSGMIVVTTFASNIARVYSIAKSAQAAGRQVALAGRSLKRMYDAAVQCGYLSDLSPLLSEDSIGHIKKENLLLICTGSQGEPLAAMNKLANETHHKLKISKGDTVIFSSKIIPGNDKRIYALMNKLCKRGIEVLTERDHFVHVSGHPARQEVAKLYELLKPKISIPVHGEAMHIHEHAKFAKSCGVPIAHEVANGDVLRISEEGVDRIATVTSGYMVIDGNFILSPDSSVMKIRRRMVEAGIVVVTVIITKDSSIKSTVIAPGLLDEYEDRELLLEISEEASDFVLTNRRKSYDTIEKGLRTIVKRLIKKETGKDPFIILQLERIS